MKTLTLKKFVLEGSEKEITYAALVKDCVKAMNQQGLDVEELRKRIRIIDALEKAGEKLELEDQDAETLKTLVRAQKWAVVDRSIIQFIEDVEAMS